MKVLLFLKKHWFKLLSFALIITIACYVVFVGIKKAKDYEVLRGNKKHQTIYSIWHIETFEGGGKSRVDYLKTIARDMEKQDETTLFMTKTIDPRVLENELKNSKPDIISFGFGVGKIVLPFLTNFDKTFDIRDELIFSGSFNQKFYAVPYIVSGYAIFNHSQTSNKFHCGTTNFTAPENIYNSLNLTPVENESQYEAYKDFVYDKNVQLLGTARDLFRINNLNNIGRTNAMITPISSYTDLVQYIGVINHNSITQKFVEFALSDIYQNTLVDYSMFSAKYNKLYYSGIYSDMEDAIYSATIPRVFYE